MSFGEAIVKNRLDRTGRGEDCKNILRTYFFKIYLPTKLCNSKLIFPQPSSWGQVFIGDVSRSHWPVGWRQDGAQGEIPARVWGGVCESSVQEENLQPVAVCPGGLAGWGEVPRALSERKTGWSVPVRDVLSRARGWCAEQGTLTCSSSHPWGPRD